MLYRMGRYSPILSSGGDTGRCGQVMFDESISLFSFPQSEGFSMCNALLSVPQSREVFNVPSLPDRKPKHICRTTHSPYPFTKR